MKHHSTNPSHEAVKVLFIEPDSTCWSTIEQAIRQCLPTAIPVRLTSFQQTLHQLIEWEDQEWELPKLIFMDIDLSSQEEGWMLLEHLKTMSTTICQIPLIILTSSSARENILKAYQLRACSYIVKPKEYRQWLSCFAEIRTYWWETVRFPPLHF